ncbi:MAG TPA: hypothetical protein VJ820_08125 [Propionibacteriaceae bacterium]|nr:hypothetical protein [Propionibacteriaceae bacterium]
MSKNPPLTEDQLRQSAEAEARHTAAQASRHSQLDYMIAEQRQQQAAAALEAIVGSEEDRFKAAASKMEDSAHRAIEELDRQGREVGEEISQLVISSRSVRDQIAAGSIASGEADLVYQDAADEPDTSYHRRMPERTAERFARMWKLTDSGQRSVLERYEMGLLLADAEPWHGSLPGFSMRVSDSAIGSSTTARNRLVMISKSPTSPRLCGAETLRATS